MNYKETAQGVLKNVGGKENIQAVTHCVTRLRFNLKDDSQADTDEVKKVPGVVGVSQQGGQYQVIIGPDVGNVYEALIQETGDDIAAGEVNEDGSSKTEKKEEEKKKGPVALFFDFLSGTFVQIIPAILAAGLISAILTILSTCGAVSTKDPTYTVFSAVQSGIFYFLPILTGYAAAKKIGMNPAIGAGLGAVLCYKTIDGAKGLSIFGLPVPVVTYSNTVFPVILGVVLMSVIEKWLNKVIPAVLKSLVVPTVTLLIGYVVTLLVLGPIGGWLGTALYTFITWISKYAGWFAPALIALIYPIMVFTGMHYSLISITIVSLSSLGYDPLLMVAGFVGNFAEAGAAFGTMAYTKNEKVRSTALGAGVSALCGITEPTLFGITLPNKKTLISVMAGGFVGTLFAGIMGVKAFNFVGGLPSLPLFIDANNSMNIIWTIVSIIISFAVTFAMTYVLNRKDVKNA